MQNRLYRFLVPAAAAAAAAAAGAAVYVLRKKAALADQKDGAGSGKVSAKAHYAPKTAKVGSYSFISGFKNAETVELSFSYDADAFCFSVVEEGFLVESGDSHVGILTGESFSAQFEYGTYYAGEDFARLRTELMSRHPDLEECSYGAHSALRFQDGDSICLIFPIPDDSSSYLQVSLLKAPDNDDPLSALPEDPALCFILASMSFARG